jgi:hypothetical protein
MLWVVGWSVPLGGVRMPKSIYAPAVAVEVIIGRLLVGGGGGQVVPWLLRSLSSLY